MSGANHARSNTGHDAKVEGASAVKDNGKEGVVHGKIMGANWGKKIAFIRTEQFGTDFFVGAHNYRRDLVDGDMVSFKFDGEPVRFEGRCPRAYNVMRIEVATNDLRHTDTTSAHVEVTSASEQWQDSTGARRRGSNKDTRAGVVSRSNLETQFSASQRVELAKMLADLLGQAGIGSAVTRA